MQHNAERASVSHLSWLEVMPLCGFNTPSHCALVAPAIPSNLATLDWILSKGPSVLWERRARVRAQRGYSGAVVFWTAPGLSSQTGTEGVTFHLLLATGKRSIPPGAGSPLRVSSTAADGLDSSYRLMLTHREP